MREPAATVPPRPGALTTWLALAAVLGLLWAVACWTQQPPAVRAQAADGELDAGRAMTTIRVLADEIGPHPIGSVELARAARYLAAELKKIPKLEVEVQDARSSNRLAMLPDIVILARVRNVLARLPGRRRDAILLSAHYDSPPEAPGGSDDGIGTAAALEALRTLASGPQLERSVVLCLNGGEEVGQAGARGFRQHRWFTEVRAWLDFEGSRAGKAALIVSTPRHPSLFDAYAAVAPAPQASTLFDDLAQSGLLAAPGDYLQFVDAGRPGLDFASVGDFWSPHTHLDRSARIDRRTVQHMGDTGLALAHALANQPGDFAASSRATVYYDLLGQRVVHYSSATARLLALLAIAVLAVPLILLLRRGELSVRRLLLGIGWHLLSLLAGLLAAIAVALFLALGLRHPHGWYATPLLIPPTFGAAGLCAVLGVHALWRRRALRRQQPEDAWLAVWASGILLWALLLTVASVVFSTGVGYLALWWVLPSALALAVAAWRPRRRFGAWLLSVGIGMLLFLQLAAMFIPVLAAMSGGVIGVPVPQDATMAVVCWLFLILPLAPCALAGPFRAGQLRRAILVFGGIAIAGVVATALRFPYTAERPKPVMMVHAQRADVSELLLAALDYPPLEPALRELGEARPVAPDARWPNAYLPGRPPEYSHRLAASRLATPPPRLEVVSTVAGPSAGTRRVRLRLHATGWTSSLEIPRDALAGWSLGEPLPTPLPGRKTVFVAYFAPDPAGEELTLELKGAAPVPIQILQVHAPGDTRELRELRERLPAWTALKAFAMHVVSTNI